MGHLRAIGRSWVQFPFKTEFFSGFLRSWSKSCCLTSMISNSRAFLQFKYVSVLYILLYSLNRSFIEGRVTRYFKNLHSYTTKTKIYLHPSFFKNTGIDPFEIISYLRFICSMSLSLLCMIDLYFFSCSRNLMKWKCTRIKMFSIGAGAIHSK